MIYATVRMIVEEKESIYDKRILLYRGDKNVELRFLITGNRFTVLNNMYAQLVIKRPSAVSVFSEPSLVTNNTVIFTVTPDMIDELLEVGEYTIQIRLFDDDLNARVTLPPCNGILTIENPIIVEESSVVNVALVNNSVVAADMPLEVEIFTEDGEYIVTEWFNGDVITDTKLNKIEEALRIMSTRQNNSSGSGVIPTRTSQLINDSGFITRVPIEYVTEAELDAKGYLTEIPSAYITETELDEKGYLTELPSDLITDEELINRGFITEEELDNRGYITELPDYNGFVTKVEMATVDAQVHKNSNDISTILGIIDEPPTYTRPTISVASNRTNVEHDIETNVRITPTYRQNDAGSITSYSLSRGGTVVHTSSSVGAYDDIVELLHGESLTYTATVSYADGVIKNTLLGIAYPATSIKAGSISASVTIRGYAMSYHGVISGDSITGTTGLTPTLRTGRSSTLNFDMNNQRIVYMYPSSFGNLISIKDANNFDYINSYTLSNMTLNGVQYNVYILTDPVTITGFRQIYS